MAPPLETPPRAALLTTVFGPTGCFRWPEVASPVLGGCPHGGVQRQLRLIRERQRLVGSQSAWQCLHKFELSEPVGHPAPPGLCGREETDVSCRDQRTGPGTRVVLHTASLFLGANQPQDPSLATTLLAKPFPSPSEEEGKPSGRPCHRAAWGCSRVAWPSSGAGAVGGWAGLGPYSPACTQMPAVGQVQCLWARKTVFDL